MEISNLIINKQRARENFFKELRLFLSLFSNIIANREREKQMNPYLIHCEIIIFQKRKFLEEREKQ